MIRNINCKWNDQGAWCKNKKVKRSLFGIGARCCVEYDRTEICSFKESMVKPPSPPPPPTLKKRQAKCTIKRYSKTILYTSR